MKLYMMVSADEYELPEIVTDSLGELERKTGKTRTNICSQIQKYNAGKVKTCRFRRVEVEDEDVH